VAAGIGRLTVIDDDEIDTSNLHRQVIHRLRDVGTPKTASASRVAANLSPDTTITPITERITAHNAARFLRDADLVIDGCDNFTTRAAVADACDSLGVPLVWGVVQEFAAQVTVFWSAPPPGHEPLRLTDLHPPESVGEPPSCASVGVLGALCMQVGGLMATEAIKLIVGMGEPLLGRVVVIDSLSGSQREVRLRARNDHDSTVTLAAQAPPRATVPEVTAAGLRAAQSAGATVLDVREPDETREGTLAGAVRIPLADVLDGYDPSGPGPFIIVCAHGARARRAAEALRDRGHDAIVLAGGLAAWDSA
jgi:adenylyltransferase/sulfurtransferase